MTKPLGVADSDTSKVDSTVEPVDVDFDWRAVRRVLERAIGGGWRRGSLGPSGVTLWHTASGYSVIVTQADHDGTDWIHASVAHRDTMPSYADLATLHRAVFGTSKYAYQVFAPAVDHVNIHPRALHLWGRADGAPALPTFGDGGTI